MSAQMKSLPVYVVIPVHNRLADTRQCLASLAKQTYSDITIVVVDDGSTDGTAQYLSLHHADVHVVHGNGSLWWTGGVAKGIEYVLSAFTESKGFALILNNDVTFKEDLIETLIHNATLLEQKVMLNGLAVSAEDKRTCVSSGALMLSWPLNLTRHPFQGQDCRLIKRENTVVDMLSGRALLVPLHAFREIGNFDTAHFPHYGGDYEFTWRAKKRGWNLLIVPDAIVYVETRHTGLNPDNVKLSLQEAFLSLFSMRSASNLRMRTRFALMCAPWYAVPSYIAIAYVKIILQTFVLNFLCR